MERLPTSLPLIYHWLTLGRIWKRLVKSTNSGIRLLGLISWLCLLGKLFSLSVFSSVKWAQWKSAEFIGGGLSVLICSVPRIVPGKQ